MNVAHQRRASLRERLFALGMSGKEFVELGAVGDLINANINHGCAGLDEVACHHARTANGGDQNIGTAANRGQVFCFGMANGHGGVGVEQQHGYGLADDIAAANDDGFLSADRNVAALQNFHASGGRAGHQARALRGKVADVHGMEAVHVFGGIDGEENFLGVHVRGQRQLNQNSVNIVADVESVNQFEQLGGGSGVRRRVLLAVNGNFFAGLHFAAHINFGGGIVTDEYNGESGTVTGSAERLYFGGDFRANFRGDFGSIKNGG